MTVNTKAVERRDISYSSVAEILTDLDAIEAAHNAGTLSTAGNWSPGQVFEHIAIVVDGSLDGSPWNAPMPMRVMAKLLFKKKALYSDDKMPSGFKLPKSAAYLVPDESTTFEAGIEHLRKGLNRVQTGGEHFNKPSPVFGKMSHEEWTTIHRKHSALHLSFLKF